MKPNWFVALPCPDDGWFADTLEQCPPPQRVRAFSPQDLHLTVAFLGPVGEAAALAAYREHRSWGQGAIAATLGGMKAMGPPRRYSALSVLLAEGRDSVEAGMAQCGSVMRLAAGLQPERRPPLAHVTLARPQRRASDAQRAAALAWAESLPVAGRRIQLTEIALYTWNDDRKERLFRIVERTELR